MRVRPWWAKAWQWVDVTRAFRNMAGDWSFTKLVIVALIVGHFTGYEFTAIMAIILISGSLGKSAWESFLQRGQWSATESRSSSSQETIARRVIDNGIAIEPAP